MASGLRDWLGMLHKKALFRRIFPGFAVLLLTMAGGCASFSGDETPSVDDIVVRVLANEDRLVEIWPGFWTPGKSFLVFDPSGDALVRTLVDPPAPYRPLVADDSLSSPELLDEYVYFHPGVPEGLSESFRISYPLGTETMTAIPVRSTMVNSLGFLFHESFHGYQREHFDEGDDTNPSLFVPRDAFSPETLVLARLEQEVLASALAAESPGDMVVHAVEYLTLRRKRLESLPAHAEQVERKWARSEGTATLAEVRGLSLLFLGNDTGVAELLSVNYLTDEFANRSPSPAESVLRWRQYGVGAAIGWILERLNVDSWQQRIEQGAFLDQVLADALEYEQQNPDLLLAELYRRHGFDERLPEARRRLESAPMVSAQDVRGARRRVVIQLAEVCIGKTGGGFTGEPIRVAHDAVLIDAHRYERYDDCMNLEIQKTRILEEAGANDVLRLQIPVRRWPRKLHPEPGGNSIVTDELHIESRRFDLELRRKARVTRTSNLLLIEFLDDDEPTEGVRL